MNEISTSVAESRQKTELVNPENFVTIQGWMVTDLHLKGASLLIYAIIYGFSQDNSSVFSGTASYLAEWASVSVYTVYDVLKKLCQQELIEKVEKEVNGVKVCDYITKRTPPVVKDHHPGDKRTPPVVKDHHPGDKRTPPPVIKDHLDNINIYNIKDNINIKKTNTKKTFNKPTLEELKEYCRQQNLTIDCEYFFDYYESNGWKVSNTPMKDWKATIRNWARREKQYKGVSNNVATTNKYAGLGRKFTN